MEYNETGVQILDRPTTKTNHFAPAIVCQSHLGMADHMGDYEPAPLSRPVTLLAPNPPEAFESNSPVHRKCSHREDISPPPEFSPQSRTTQLVNTALHEPEFPILFFSWNSLRKFIDGKETAKIADIVTQAASAQALTAFIFCDIRSGLVIFVRHGSPCITTLITTINPTTCIG